MAQLIFTAIMNISLLVAVVLLIVGIIRAVIHKKSANMFITMVVFIFTAIFAFFGGTATSPVVRQNEALRTHMDGWDLEVFLVFIGLVAICWLIFYFTRRRKK